MTDPFDALEDAIRRNLPRHLPGGVNVNSVRLAERGLRVEARAAFFAITLTAQVIRTPEYVRFYAFALEGALGAGGAALRDEVSRIDEAWGPFRAKGADGGGSLVVTLA